MSPIVAIVDDDDRVLEALEDLLQSAGHEVRLFRSAKALLDGDDFAAIDCLISDIGMPAMGGLELERVAHEARPELPVIFITGRDLTDAVRAASQRSHGFFRKPFDAQELLATVRRALCGD